MTERMENALRHIKTSVDVDPWAVEEVERVFKAYEQTQPQETVSRGVFEQVMWERDIAIEQLKELGYSLGEKIEPQDGDLISKQSVRDAIAEIKSYKSKYNNQEYGQSYAIKAVNDVLEIILRHTGVKE